MWEKSWKGGLFFGLTLGALVGFHNFFLALVIAGMPYYLMWCWAGTEVLSFGVLGVVLGLIVKRADT